LSEDESQRSREPRWADLLQRHQDSLLRPLHLQGLRREDLVGKMPPVEGTTASGVERTNSLLNMEVRNKGTSLMRVKPRDNCKKIINEKRYNSLYSGCYASCLSNICEYDEIFIL
jgi:hypothetical protein